MNSLIGKIAIVTGARGAIGSATSKVLARHGAKVYAAELCLESALATAKEIKDLGGWAEAIAFDLSREDEIEAAMNGVAAAQGRIDILYNCAADCSPDVVRLDVDTEGLDVAVWDRAFAINLRGTMLCSKYALSHMPHHAGATIINTASNTGLQGNLKMNAYSCSKAAILQLTRNIATSHGKFGIRCNTVTPGLVLTKKTEKDLPKRFREIVESETLLPSLGEPDDIAHTVAFLASDEAKYITGQNIVVDGGTSVHTPGFAQLRELFAQGE